MTGRAREAGDEPTAKDWAWRARLRRNRLTHLLWRTTVGVVGAVVTVTGLVLVPAPGPGWLIVFFGLLILASEFELAQRVLDVAREQVSRWNRWLMAQGPWLRGLVALGTCVVVWGFAWAYLAVVGVPGFVPEWASAQLGRLPGVD